jgi:hypothetical protein
MAPSRFDILQKETEDENSNLRQPVLNLCTLWVPTWAVCPFVAQANKEALRWGSEYRIDCVGPIRPYSSWASTSAIEIKDKM